MAVLIVLEIILLSTLENFHERDFIRDRLDVLQIWHCVEAIIMNAVKLRGNKA